LLWLAERKHSPEQFPNEPLNGIGTGMWLAIVTMTTVGYGDKAPVTLSGRIIAGSWMIISIIFATSMVAGIASTLTLTSLGTSSISKIEEVNNKKIATISGSPAESFIQTYKAKINPVAHLSEAFEKLKNKEIDAVVYDRPQLLYYIKTHDEEELSISKAEYFKQGYGFAFPLNSTMVYDVNKSLLKLAEMQKTTDIIDEYLGKDE
jgi:polar amino acid transport system substrate-binding protein